MGKIKTIPKMNGKRRMEEEEPVIKMPKGCPCPGLKGCVIGHAVYSGEESLTLICSAITCPFSGMFIHKQCFEKYEDQLLKTLGDRGSARGWTEYKARRNLWKPCGQGLIAQYCRCICEKGNVRPPEDVILAERILVAPMDGDRKKKTKKKDLPIINMNGGANAKQARTQARIEREEMIEEERNLGREFHTPPYTPRRTRNNSVTSFSSQSIVSTSSNVRTGASDRGGIFTRDEESIVPRGRVNQGRRGRGGGKKREESRARLDSGVSLRTPIGSPVKECVVPLVPALTPPPMMRSYAATIASLPQVSHSSEEMTLARVMEPPPSTPILPIIPNNTFNITIGGLKLMPERWYTKSSIEWEMVGIHYDPKILASHETLPSLFLPMVDPFNYSYIPEWNPWKGQDLVLGKFSILGLKLPSK